MGRSAVVVGAVLLFSTAWSLRPGTRCEPIRVHACRKQRYNLTQMPNFLDHNNQHEAEESLLQFTKNLPAGWSRCSPHLEFFLCALHVPMCQLVGGEPLTLLPCRGMCQQIKADCLPYMKAAGMDWPEKLACSILPGQEKEMCIAAPEIRASGYTKQSEATSTRPLPLAATRSTHTPLACPSKYLMPHSANTDEPCIPRCDADVLFTTDDKRRTNHMLVTLTVLCLCVTGLVLLTSLIDRSRFRYPERPILFLALCYLMQSIGYLIRTGLGAQRVACDNIDGAQGAEAVLAREGLDQPFCALLFLLLYYSETAAGFWWLVLSLAWLLAAGRKWSAEAVRAASGYFHAAAWALPAALSISALSLRHVTADELTGTCTVRPGSALLGFVLTPRALCLVVGATLILAGFVSMIRIRHNLKNEGTNLRRMETLMVKLGVFSFLFCTCSSVSLGALVYEYVNTDAWLTASRCLPGDTCELTASVPPVPLLQVRLAASLLAGLTCVVWIWGTKTLQTWQHFCCTRWKHQKKNDGRGRYQAPADSGHHMTTTGHVSSQMVSQKPIQPKHNSSSLADV